MKIFYDVIPRKSEIGTKVSYEFAAYIFNMYLENGVSWCLRNVDTCVQHPTRRIVAPIYCRYEQIHLCKADDTTDTRPHMPGKN